MIISTQSANNKKNSTEIQFQVKLSDFFNNISVKWIKDLITGTDEINFLFDEHIDLSKFKKPQFSIG